MSFRFDMIGGVVSFTSTLNLIKLVLDEKSFAVHVTGVLPIGNVVPERGEHVTGLEPSIASLAVVEKVTLVPEDVVASFRTFETD